MADFLELDSFNYACKLSLIENRQKVLYHSTLLYVTWYHSTLRYVTWYEYFSKCPDPYSTVQFLPENFFLKLVPFKK